MKHLCWLRNARQIVQVTPHAEVTVVTGSDMKNIHTIDGKDGDGLSLVIDANGRIFDIGLDSILTKRYADDDFKKVIDVGGCILMPGLVDGHTHPVFAGDRVHEFAMKLAGATYMQVHEAGGGIHFTVEKTRLTTEDDLFQDFKKIAKSMLRNGTTTLEAKSGYGLEKETEIKMLNVLERVHQEGELEISGTFCGAHAVPKGSTSEAATDDVINVQLPAVNDMRAQGKLSCVENVDVFCERGVFSVPQTRRILEAAASVMPPVVKVDTPATFVTSPLRANFHGDELHPTESAQLAASVGAAAVSHLEEISDAGIEAIAAKGTVAVLLPTTAYVLRLKAPPARKMLDAGVAVALGSDFNPNAYCYSMPMVMHLACCQFRMTLAEALNAATINAAASVGRGRTHGALHLGRVGDVLIVNAPSWEHLIYRFGCATELIQGVIKKGTLVHCSLLDAVTNLHT